MDDVSNFKVGDVYTGLELGPAIIGLPLYEALLEAEKAPAAGAILTVVAVDVEAKTVTLEER